MFWVTNATLGEFKQRFQKISSALPTADVFPLVAEALTKISGRRVVNGSVGISYRAMKPVA